MEKATSKRSSALLEQFDLGEGVDGGKGGQESRVSAILRGESAGSRPPKTPRSRGEGGILDRSPSHSFGSQMSRNASYVSGDRPTPPDRPQPSFISSTPQIRTDSNSPGHSVARADIKASAEKILYTFVLPGSEREIVLPDTMLNRIIRAIEEEGRDDPEVFDDAKDYVFQAMERDAFPGFLQAKALGNLVPLSILIRLIIGLTCLMAGFWAGYYMILRDKPRATRCWVRPSLSYTFPRTPPPGRIFADRNISSSLLFPSQSAPTSLSRTSISSTSSPHTGDLVNTPG